MLAEVLVSREMLDGILERISPSSGTWLDPSGSDARGTVLQGSALQIGRPEGGAWGGAGDSELLGSAGGGYAMKVGELSESHGG